MTWMPERYAESSASRCLFKVSKVSSAQRFWRFRPHSVEGAPAPEGTATHCCVHCLNISCCISSEDSDAFRKVSKSISNIVPPMDLRVHSAAATSGDCLKGRSRSELAAYSGAPQISGHEGNL